YPVSPADSGWPSPDIRWHAPQASAAPWPFCTSEGGARCSSGNQSGGLFRSSICAGVYDLVLPGTLLGPGSSAGTDPLMAGNAHEGPGGAGGCCARSTRTESAITPPTATSLLIDAPPVKAQSL